MKLEEFLGKISRKIAIEVLSRRLRRTPVDTDASRLMENLRSVSENTSILGRVRTYRTRSGVVIRGDVHDVITRNLFLFGEWEPGVSSLLAALLRPGDLMLDIGANIGWHALHAAKILGENGQCIAFEPVPSVRSYLEKNLRLNGVTNCAIRPEALCDHNGRAVMRIVEGHTGISSMVQLDTPSTTSVDVPAARLDDLMIFDRRVNLIKLDVEGAEASVIAGMARLLARDRPDLIIEMGDARLRTVGSSAVSLCQQLISLGYNMHPLQPEEEGGGVLPALSDLSTLPATFDALFTIRESLPPACHSGEAPPSARATSSLVRR